MSSAQSLAWIISGSFTAATVIAASVLIWKHLRNYHNPLQQRLIVRILLIAPIYAVDSFLSLLFRQAAVYFNTIRDCYESFVIYSFLSLLVQYLGGVDSLVRKLSAKSEQVCIQVVGLAHE